MATAEEDPVEGREKPLDPEVEKVRKSVRFDDQSRPASLALMVVIGALVYKPRNAPAATRRWPATSRRLPASRVSGDIGAAVGAKAVSQSLSGNRVSIDAESCRRQPHHLRLRHR